MFWCLIDYQLGLTASPLQSHIFDFKIAFYKDEYVQIIYQLAMIGIPELISKFYFMNSWDLGGLLFYSLQL